MTALSSIFPNENPFEQDFKKASQKSDENGEKEPEKGEKLTLPGPEAITDVKQIQEVVEEEQELDEQQANGDQAWVASEIRILPSSLLISIFNSKLYNNPGYRW